MSETCLKSLHLKLKLKKFLIWNDISSINIEEPTAALMLCKLITDRFHQFDYFPISNSSYKQLIYFYYIYCHSVNFWAIVSWNFASCNVTGFNFYSSLPITILGFVVFTYREADNPKCMQPS